MARLGNGRLPLARETSVLIAQLYTAEFGTNSQLPGLLLYALATVFSCYWSLRQSTPAVWNAVYWILLMFSGINSASKSFLLESRGKALYFYTIASPKAVILSRLIFNILLLLVVSICALFLYSLLLGFPVIHYKIYFFTVFLGCLSLSSIFTLLSAIASRTSNSTTLVAILGIPIFLPLLYLLLQLSSTALTSSFSLQAVLKDTVVLVALNAVVILMTVASFPYIWRD